ncbi:MAG: Rieske 2Fe-2S domain-containing protein [Myxococcaceae bacterium]
MKSASVMLYRVFRLGPAERIPVGEGRTFAVGGNQVAVFRTRTGGVYATQAECPHRKGPLAEGLLGGSAVACPFHGFKFDLATGAPVGHDCGALRTFRVELDASGELLLYLEGSR